MDPFRSKRGLYDEYNEARFEALYSRYYGRVLAYVLRRARPEVAHDTVADTFLVAWRRLDQVPGDPLPWLLAVARKTMANQRRTARRQNALIGELKAEGRLRAPAASAADIAEVEAVGQAVGRLSELDQELLKLVAWDGLSMKQAAAVVGITHVACRVRIHRARRRLADEFANGKEDAGASSHHRFQITEEDLKL